MGFALATAVFINRFAKNAKIQIFVFGWIAIFVFAGSIYIFYKMNEKSLENTGTPWILFLGVYVSMILMVVLIVVTNNTQIKLYDGNGYVQSLYDTVMERKTNEYVQSL